MALIRILLKITGIIPALLAFLPKKYYLGSKIRSTRKLKGPLIIVENHRGFLDVPVVITMFPFRKVNLVVSELLYDWSKWMRILLRAFGAIRADRFSGNPSFINESVKVLKKGGVLLLYPEGKIETTDELMEFKRSVATISILADAPVLPIFHNGNIGFLKRDKCFLGDLMYPADFTEEQHTLAENAKDFTDAIFRKISAYHDFYYDSFPGKAEKHVPFGYRFILYTGMPLLHLFYRPQIVAQSDLARAMVFRQNRMILISNHSWWIDAPMIYSAFHRTLPRCIAAKDTTEDKPFTHAVQKTAGCIFLDRTGFDWGCIKQCLQELNHGGCLLLFPEGHFNFQNDVSSFQTGAAMMALMTHSPVVPIYFSSSYEPFKRSYFYIGDPIPTGNEPVTNERVKALTEQYRQRINELKVKADARISKREKAAIMQGKQHMKSKI